MENLTEYLAGVDPVKAYPQQIQFGPVVLEGFQLEDGSFCQSLNSTARALGANDTLVRRSLLKQVNAAEAQKAVDHTGLATQDPELAEAPQLTLIKNPQGGGTAITLPLDEVVNQWLQVAFSDSKHALMAKELLALAAKTSLQQVYQEAFGVRDDRSTTSMLIDLWLDSEVSVHTAMYQGDFAKNFARVTGYAIGHPAAAVCFAELIYWRLPEAVYEAAKDLNPHKEGSRWREYSHDQLLSPEGKARLREIVMVVGSFLACAESKSDDPKAYAKLINQLDKALPRYRTRGRAKGAKLELKVSKTPALQSPDRLADTAEQHPHLAS